MVRVRGFVALVLFVCSNPLFAQDVAQSDSALVAELRAAAAVPMSAPFALATDRCAQAAERGAVPILIEALGRVRGVDAVANQSRIGIARALGRFRDPTAVPAVVGLLEDQSGAQDLHVNRVAAEALGRIGDPRAAEPLARALFLTVRGESIQPAVRVALAGLGPAGVEPLARILRNEDGVVRARADRAMLLPSLLSEIAARALGDIGDPAAVPALLEALRGEDAAVVAAAATALGAAARSGDNLVLDALVAALGRGNATARTGAIEGLERLADPRATGVLLALGRAAPARAPDLAARAARAYARLADPAGAAELAAIVVLPSTPSARAEMAASLSLLQSGARCRRDVGCLLGALEHGGDLEREKAAWLLGVIGISNSPLHRALAARIADPAVEVRYGAMIALDRLARSGCSECAERIEALVEREQGQRAYESVNRDALALAARLRRRGRGRP